MKIGILTYHWVANFGANLQTLSTVCYLKKNGFIPIVINWIPLDCELKYQSSTPVEQLDAHASFSETYFETTRVCRTNNEILDIIEEYEIDAIIIGSDSLFNIMKPSFNWIKFKKNVPTTDHVFPNPYWGDFYEKHNIPIAGLSISNQNSDFFKFKNQKNEIKKCLMNFSHLSVRDDWTQKMIGYMTDDLILPSITPDPVFSFNCNVPPLISRQEICRKYSLPDKYILLSFSGGIRSSVSEHWLKSFKKMANAQQISCVSLPRTFGGQIMHLDVDLSLPISPIDWYYIIKYSQGYVGVLMHPIIVAIHNNIPFFSFDHYGVSKFLFFANKATSKIYHILSQAGMLSNYYNLRSCSCFPTPDYVFDCIMNFDHSLCADFASAQAEKCLLNYSSIIKSFYEKR